MKIAIIGATGGTGRAFTTQAIANGHTVSALVRSPDKLTQQKDGLQLIVGDARNGEDIGRTVADQDAVFCAIGGGTNTGPTTIRQDATRLIVDALQGTQTHLVIVSSLGVGDSKPQLAWYLRPIITYILRHPFADHLVQEQIVRTSNLTWTILRPTNLGNGAATHNIRLSCPPERVPAQPNVARADVAALALSIIEQKSHLSEAITLTN